LARIIPLMASAFACNVACSAGPHDAPLEPPPESQLDPPASPGCRFAERPLGKDEVFETWPAPSQLAAAVNHEYVGPMSWRDADAHPADEIEVAIEIDPEHVTLRYPISPPRPNEPIYCVSSLVVPIATQLRLGGTEAELSGLYVTYGRTLDLSAKLPESFVATFVTEHVDGYTAYLLIPFDGSAVGGRFELHKGGVVPRTPANFHAE
jgi:hypothetical protein